MKNENDSMSIVIKVKNQLLLIMLSSILVSCFYSKASEISETFEINTAKNAWINLVGEKFSSRPEFMYIKNKPELPNILLYGDSISIHYTQELREILEDKANIYRLFRNGGDSGSFIPKMDKMHAVMQNTALKDHWSFSWDIIHFNVGLHDLKYIKNRKLDKVNGKQVTSIKQYQTNLRRIINYLKKLSPKAKLIFATTTPIPEGEKGRFVGDAVRYNQAAIEVLKDFPEVQVNDLYQHTKPNHPKWWSRPGDVHYNFEGQAAQAQKVSSAILAQNLFH